MDEFVVIHRDSLPGSHKLLDAFSGPTHTWGKAPFENKLAGKQSFLPAPLCSKDPLNPPASLGRKTHFVWGSVTEDFGAT